MTPKQQIEQFAKINNYKPIQSLYDEALLAANAKTVQKIFRSNSPQFWAFIINYCKNRINEEAKTESKKRADAHNAYAKRPFQPDHDVNLRAFTRLELVARLTFIAANKATPKNKKLWNKAIGLAKRKFDVWPSRNATWWADSYYKKHGGKWQD